MCHTVILSLNNIMFEQHLDFGRFLSITVLCAIVFKQVYSVYICMSNSYPVQDYPWQHIFVLFFKNHAKMGDFLLNIL